MPLLDFVLLSCSGSYPYGGVYYRMQYVVERWFVVMCAIGRVYSIPWKSIPFFVSAMMGMFGIGQFLRGQCPLYLMHVWGTLSIAKVCLH